MVTNLPASAMMVAAFSLGNPLNLHWKLEVSSDNNDKDGEVSPEILEISGMGGWGAVGDEDQLKPFPRNIDEFITQGEPTIPEGQVD